MTPEQQRTAIAEACGWKRWKTHSGRVVLAKPRDDNQREYWLSCGDAPTDESLTDGEKAAGFVPDYLNDLNAMHEAEKTLSEDEYDHYCFGVLMGESQMNLSRPEAICATATQRAEAFLRTIGKWEESPVLTPTQSGV